MPIINMVDTVLTVAVGIEDLELAQVRQAYRNTRFAGETVPLQGIFDLLDAINRIPPRFSVVKIGLKVDNPYAQKDTIQVIIEIAENDIGFIKTLSLIPSALMDKSYVRKIVSNLVNDRLKHIKSEEE